MSSKTLPSAQKKYANESRAATLPGKTRILLVNDDALASEALGKLLEPECQIVGRVSDSRVLLEAALKFKPDVIVLDLNVLGPSDKDRGRELKELLPNAKIVALSVTEDPDVAMRALHAWASAFILKKSAGRELITAVREVRRGRPYVTTSIGKKVGEKFPQGEWSGQNKVLTSRQREVLQLLAKGCTMKEVAAALGITPRTVAFHKYKIMREFWLKNNSDLILLAIKVHVIPPP